MNQQKVINGNPYGDLVIEKNLFTYNVDRLSKPAKAS